MVSPISLVVLFRKTIMTRGASRLMHWIGLPAALLFAAACSESPSEPTSPIGQYTLQSVDGKGLPTTLFQDEGYMLQLTGGTLEVEADQTYVAAITTLEMVDINVSEYVDSLRGTWTQDNAGLMQFSVVPQGGFTGSWIGRQITALVTDGQTSMSLVFERSR
jgi:hypothetical protein